MLRDPFPTDGIPFYKGRRVVVTGASGLIGSYAVKLLKESGAKVRALIHHRPANEFTRLADYVVHADLMHPVDIGEKLQGFDIVIGCAGVTGGVNLPKIDPVSYVGPASVMAMNTLHACWKEKVERFGYLSSTTVYMPAEHAVAEGEEALLLGEPYPLYRGISHSKRFLEKLCRYYHETTGIGVGIVRPAGAYGRFDNFDEMSSHVIPGVIGRAERFKRGAITGRNDSKFEVWGDGQDVRDFIHSQDVARSLLIAVAESPKAEPMNAASGIPTTTGQLARTILDAVGLPSTELAFRPDKPSALKTRLVSTVRAESLGFKAEISLKAGIADTVAWIRENNR